MTGALTNSADGVRFMHLALGNSYAYVPGACWCLRLEDCARPVQLTRACSQPFQCHNVCWYNKASVFASTVRVSAVSAHAAVVAVVFRHSPCQCVRLAAAATCCCFFHMHASVTHDPVLRYQGVGHAACSMWFVSLGACPRRGVYHYDYGWSLVAPLVLPCAP